MAKYIMDETYVQRYEAAIREGQPMCLEIMEADSRCWLLVKAVLAPGPIEGSQPVSLYNFIKGAASGKEYHIKVMEEVDEEDAEIPHAREPFSIIPKGPPGPTP